MKFLVLVLLFILPVMSFGDKYQGKRVVVAKEAGHHPIKEEECVKKSPSGVCREFDFTYGVAGVTCTEDCVDFDSFDHCRIRNICKYDKKSGCFKKETCEKISDLNVCKNWKTKLLCN